MANTCTTWPFFLPDLVWFSVELIFSFDSAFLCSLKILVQGVGKGKL